MYIFNSSYLFELIGSFRRRNFSSLATLILIAIVSAACQSAAASPTSTPLLPPRLVATATSTPSPTATADLAGPAELILPDYVAPALAPFPLTPGQLRPTDVGSPFDQAAAWGAPYQAAHWAAPVALSPNDHFYFSLPVAPANINNSVPSQRYGVIDPDFESENAHTGLDLSVHSRIPVLAAAPGEVLWASYGLLYNSVNYLEDPYGIAVVILHDFGYEGRRLYTIYGHLSEANVEVGDQVERGQLIALSGSTGQSTGPHLHFEVRTGTNTIYFTRNPEMWIAPPEGAGALVGRVENTNGARLLNRLVELVSQDSGKRYIVYTYATPYRILADDYYAENLVLGDLPAGRYTLGIPFMFVWQRVDIEIKPGAVTYFEFHGLDGFSFDLPTVPRPENAPG